VARFAEERIISREALWTAAARAAASLDYAIQPQAVAVPPQSKALRAKTELKTTDEA